MKAFESLTSCAELTTEHAEQAARSATSLRAFLSWAARVAKPSDGAPKVLMGIARLANADWIEGTPYVEITGNDKETAINVFSDHGLGIRERVVPLVRLRVPASELLRAVRLAPQLIFPFQAVQKKNDTLVLTPREVAELDADGEPIKIDDRSLHESERKTAPPPKNFGGDSAGSPDGRKSGVPAIPGSDLPTSDQSGVHTHPTVRRMVAVKPEALRSGNDDD